jgi:hypothetical protein
MKKKINNGIWANLTLDKEENGEFIVFHLPFLPSDRLVPPWRVNHYHIKSLIVCNDHMGRHETLWM